MKHTLSFMVWAILAVLLPLQMAQAAAPPTELQKRLQNLPDISDIKPMQSDAYPEKYVFFINQLLDPHHPEAGNFKQRVILSHVGFDRPTRTGYRRLCRPLCHPSALSRRVIQIIQRQSGIRGIPLFW